MLNAHTAKWQTAQRYLLRGTDVEIEPVHDGWLVRCNGTVVASGLSTMADAKEQAYRTAAEMQAAA
jgi:hypothetical protein